MNAASVEPVQTAKPAAGRWRRRLGVALAVLLGLWGLGWLGLPPLLKWQLQKQASAALGRTVTVERVAVRPWSLELELTGLKVADADGTGEQFSLVRLYVDAELQSLLRLAPVVDALTQEQPRLRLRHLGQGRYDVDDVLQRLDPPDTAPPGQTPKFALFNLALSGGSVELVDEPVATTHRLNQLVVRLPFLSNLESRREVKTQPLLAFELNGSAFDSSGETAPFAPARETDLRLQVPSLDLAPYLAYWPARWPLRPTAGFVHLDLRAAFEQREAPRVIVSGPRACRACVCCRCCPALRRPTDCPLNVCRLTFAAPNRWPGGWSWARSPGGALIWRCHAMHRAV